MEIYNSTIKSVFLLERLKFSASPFGMGGTFEVCIVSSKSLSISSVLDS